MKKDKGTKIGKRGEQRQMNFFRKYIHAINTLNELVGRLVSYLIYPMILILVYEVIMRYVFDHPTVWAHELSAFLYAIVFLLGSSYAMRYNSHICVEILYARLPVRAQAILDLITWNFFYFFIGLLLWEGWPFALKSIHRMELAGSVWDPPIWPIKLCIPLGALLMLLQGSAKTIQDVHMAFTGKALIAKAGEEGGTQ